MHMSLFNRFMSYPAHQSCNNRSNFSILILKFTQLDSYWFKPQNTILNPKIHVNSCIILHMSILSLAKISVDVIEHSYIQKIPFITPLQIPIHSMKKGRKIGILRECPDKKLGNLTYQCYNFKKGCLQFLNQSWSGSSTVKNKKCWEEFLESGCVVSEGILRCKEGRGWIFQWIFLQGIDEQADLFIIQEHYYHIYNRLQWRGCFFIIKKKDTELSHSRNFKDDKNE